jgi:hypothetical protein
LKLSIHDIDMAKNMADKNRNWSRRDFMKIAGAAGVGAVVSPMEHLAGAVVKSESEVSAPQYVPTRPFGMSGVDVSILTLGGTLNFLVMRGHILTINYSSFLVCK